MTKVELAKAAGFDDSKADYAVPQGWLNNLSAAIGSGEQPRFFVWDYADATVSGSPVNLAERFVERNGDRYQKLERLAEIILERPCSYTIEDLKRFAEYALERPAYAACNKEV